MCGYHIQVNYRIESKQSTVYTATILMKIVRVLDVVPSTIYDSVHIMINKYEEKSVELGSHHIIINARWYIASIEKY